MEELKDIIADNLIDLRKANKLTQLELAEKLNYSDKAISKWERGESLPDIAILKQLADMYGVGIDYIVTKHSEETKAKYHAPKPELNNKLIITLLAWLSVWILATILYINFKIMFDNYYWMIWIWALPVSCIILIVFSSIWGKRWMIITSVSILIWTLILASYLQFLKYNIWSLFLLGIPAQLATALCGKIKRNKKIEQQK
ncbi:MAG: helix-turn-helix transcriptional regulator [Clostridia bacterium]|nr:helix-turn-helix transcriptional regulator [Clostridia bacterium]